MNQLKSRQILNKTTFKAIKIDNCTNIIIIDNYPVRYKQGENQPRPGLS